MKGAWTDQGSDFPEDRPEQFCMRTQPGWFTTRRMMIATAIVAIEFNSSTCVLGTDETFFPDLVFDKDKEGNEFIVEWFTKHLKAMKERSLWMRSQKDRATTVYRFLWLPTFDRPISVRIEKSGNSAVLHVVQLDGRGGYEPGKIIADKSAVLSSKQWDEVKRRLDKIKFWQLPTEDKAASLGTDGDQLILEGAMAGKYHIVDRWGPDSGNDYAGLCRYMLELSGLDVMKIWEKYRE
jgi:hypothetical protein